MIDIEMAHNFDTSGNGACLVITGRQAIDKDDLPNWHEASAKEYDDYLAYWTSELPCGHERGEHCTCENGA